MKSYFDEVIEKLNSLSDEEFMETLYQAGLERCPEIKNAMVGVDLSSCEDITIKYEKDIDMCKVSNLPCCHCQPCCDSRKTERIEKRKRYGKTNLL